MITGASIPIVEGTAPAGKYVFNVGFKAPGFDESLASEEAVYKVTPTATWLFGDDSTRTPKAAPIKCAINKASRTGTMFAVYIFLERELGIKWQKPGDDGIVFTPSKTLSLKEGESKWTPRLTMRNIRPGYSKKSRNFSKKTPKHFQRTQKQRDDLQLKTKIWLKRMKMGSAFHFGYGHAFTKWWKKYGKEHPEYFALNSEGKREPLRNKRPDRVKLCVSNPEVLKVIVENFVNSGAKVINTCANDSGNYCECPKCRALDVPLKGETPERHITYRNSHLTDRYVWFANQLLRMAKKRVPDAKAIMYAYSCYRFPPRREKVDKDLILGFVPHLLNPDLDAYYHSWQKVGARKFFLRPNDMFFDPGLPIGFEKRMFDNFQVCMKYGAFGTDYDSIHNFWPSSGIANYIMARAIADPTKSFEYWMDDYCSTYGPAADDVRKYYDYWRKNIFESKLVPDRKKIQEKGRYGNFTRGLMWLIGDYYTESDFDKTDAFLQAGLKKKLSIADRKRLNTLLLENQHARLTFEAMKAKNLKPRDYKKLLTAAKALLAFRKKHNHDLYFDWEFLFGNEIALGDVCGINTVASFDGFNALVNLKRHWYFKIDPKNAGLTEKWHGEPWDKIEATWDDMQIGTFWERAKCDPALHTELAKYDGVGWYATRMKIDAELRNRKLFLNFGAVDESCQVYVNGKLAGAHLYLKPDDWKTPFKIPINKFLDWKSGKNTLVVRVEDKKGAGGIWQPVWIVAEQN
jgi:hypothetical protein